MIAKDRIGGSTRDWRVVLLGAVMWAASIEGVSAEELLTRGVAPPPALQFPSEAGPNARFAVAVSTLVPKIEHVANTMLCAALMKERGQPVPEKFDFAQCPSDLSNDILNEVGGFRWAHHGMPSECTSGCIARPGMWRVGPVGEPTLRTVLLNGKLPFLADIEGQAEEANYHYSITFTCEARDAARNGVLRTHVRMRGGLRLGFGGPDVYFIDMDEFGAALQSAIAAALPRLSSVRAEDPPPCRSVGIIESTNVLLDQIAYDPPLGGVNATVTGGTGSRRQAKIEFLRVTRRPLLSIVPVETAAIDDPTSGLFTIYANGVRGFFSLPAALGLGQSVEIGVCKTIDMKDADRVQVITTTGLGGTTWSQFTAEDSFGVGPIQKLTTARVVDIPDPPGGVGEALESPSNETSILMREFEVQYRITLLEPNTAAGPLGGAVTGVGAGSSLAVEADPGQPQPAPCRQI